MKFRLVHMRELKRLHLRSAIRTAAQVSQGMQDIMSNMKDKSSSLVIKTALLQCGAT
jgi:hypothetical protein